MEVSRLLRVLITILLVVSFFIIVFSSYNRDRRVEAMTELSDATSSIATRLTTQNLARVDADGIIHPYELNADLLDNLRFEQVLGDDNFEYQASISYLAGGEKENKIEYGPEPPGNQTISALSLPVGLYEEGIVLPAKLKVIAWYG